MRPPRLDEAKIRRIIRTAFAGADGHMEGFQHAVQAIMRETGLAPVEARWLVMQLRENDPG